MFSRRNNFAYYFIDQDLVNNYSARLSDITEEIKLMFSRRNNFSRYFVDPDLVNHSPENSSVLESSTTSQSIKDKKATIYNEIQTLTDAVHKHDVTLAELIMDNKRQNESMHNLKKRLDKLEKLHHAMTEMINFDENV
jgi:hypothetical protein